jgi:hypothetical protein
MAASLNANRESSIGVGDGLSLAIDFDKIEPDLMARLDHAVEVTPLPRRGRPPVRK